MTARRLEAVVLVATGLALAVATLAAWRVVRFRPASLVPVPLRPASSLEHAVGVLHVHSRRSDGSGSVDQICETARQAGLDFVVVTDHGEPPGDTAPPVYIDRTLCASGAELSVDGGHYLEVGAAPVPYRLGGDPRDVAEDVRRLGGVGFAAHPDSVKPELRWHDWTAPIDGLELLNGDTVWRRASRRQLAAASLLYVLNPRFALARLLAPDERLFAEWDRLVERRPIVAVVGADAHARVGRRTWRSPEDDTTDQALNVPSYGAMFAMFRMHVLWPPTPRADARDRVRALVGALGAGRAYLGLDALADASQFAFEAGADGRVFPLGATIHPAGSVDFRVAVTAPPGSRTQLLRNGVIVRDEAAAHELRYRSAVEGAYRVEVWLDPRVVRAGAQFPWIVSNPIYVHRDARWAEAAARPAATRRLTLETFEDREGIGWHAETGGGSSLAGPQPESPGAGGSAHAARFQFHLAPAPPDADTWAALVDRTPRDLCSYDRLTFEARADTPMRLSVQLRVSSEGGGSSRWRRSVYLDAAWRTETVFFDEMQPADAPRGSRPDLARVQSLLFVVDPEHTFPGTSGRYWLDDIRVEGK